MLTPPPAPPADRRQHLCPTVRPPVSRAGICLMHTAPGRALHLVGTQVSADPKSHRPNLLSLLGKDQVRASPSAQQNPKHADGQCLADPGPLTGPTPLPGLQYPLVRVSQGSKLGVSPQPNAAVKVSSGILLKTWLRVWVVMLSSQDPSGQGACIPDIPAPPLLCCFDSKIHSPLPHLQAFPSALLTLP